MLDLMPWEVPVRLGPDDLPSLILLHKELHAGLAQRELFARETDAFFAECLAGGGQVYGIKHNGCLAAYGVLGLPKADSVYNFGAWAGLDESLLHDVAHVDGAGVHPNFRGRGFQRALIACRLNAATNAGRSHVYSTASPHNSVSLINLLVSGFVIVCLRPLFGGLSRYILRYVGQSIQRPLGMRVVSPCDFDTQRHLLAQGFVGMRHGSGTSLAFTKLPEAVHFTIKGPWFETAPA